MKPLKDRRTACADCEHFKPTLYDLYGICMRKDGPTGKVFGKTWILSEGHKYPSGCPIDPDPPPPPRKRPGKKRNRKGRNDRQAEDPKHEGMRRKKPDGW